MPPNRRLRYSPQARNDLNAIISYSAEVWGERHMKEYTASLTKALDGLVQFPTLGRVREDLAPDLRSYPVGQHVVLYRLTDDTGYIVRLLHRSHDIEQEINE
jgi:toxin ParE1/3/4